LVDLGTPIGRSPEMNILLWSFFFLVGGILVTYASVKFITAPKTTFLLSIIILAFTTIIILILSLVLRTIIYSELERREKINRVKELLNDN
jgi:hypothetical protein